MSRKILILALVILANSYSGNLTAQVVIPEVSIGSLTFDGIYDTLTEHSIWGASNSYYLDFFVSPWLEEGWAWQYPWSERKYRLKDVTAFWKAVWHGDRVYFYVEMKDNQFDSDHVEDFTNLNEDDGVQFWFESHRNVTSPSWSWGSDINYLIHNAIDTLFFKENATGTFNQYPNGSDPGIEFALFKNEDDSIWSIESSITPIGRGRDVSNKYDYNEFIWFNITFNDADYEDWEGDPVPRSNRLAWLADTLGKAAWEQPRKLTFGGGAVSAAQQFLSAQNVVLKHYIINVENDSQIVVDGRLDENVYKHAIPIILTSYRDVYDSTFTWKFWDNFSDAAVIWRSFWNSDSNKLYLAFKIFDDYLDTTDFYQGNLIDDDGLVIFIDLNFNGNYDPNDDINILIHNNDPTKIYRNIGIGGEEKYDRDSTYTRGDIKFAIDYSYSYYYNVIEGWFAEIEITLDPDTSKYVLGRFPIEVGYNDADREGNREHQLVWSAVTQSQKPWVMFQTLGNYFINNEPLIPIIPYDYDPGYFVGDVWKYDDWNVFWYDTIGYIGSLDLTISWNQAVDEQSGIDGYQIIIGTAPGDSNVYNKVVGSDTTNLTIRGKHGQTLYAMINPINGSGLSSKWSGASYGITIDTTPPSAPGKPRVTSSTGVTLAWSSALDQESGIIDYHLQLGTAPGDSSVYNEWIRSNDTTFTVSGSTGGTLYARVRAKNRTGSIGKWSESSDGITIVPSILIFGENENDDIHGVTCDTYVRNTWTRVNFNYGGSERIRIGKKEDHINRGLIKFDFIPTLIDSGVTSPRDIISASLSLKVDNGGRGEPQNVDIYRVLKDWGEGIHDHKEATSGEATWNSAQRFVVNWTEVGVSGVEDREAEFDATTLVNIYPATYTWDVTTSVREIFENKQNFGWLIKGRNDEEDFKNDIDNFIFFNSKDHPGETGLPRLTIEFSGKPVVSILDTITFGESGEEVFSNVTFDSYIDGGREDYNMGNCVLLRVGYRRYDQAYRTLIKFDFIDSLASVGITNESQIVDAWLQLNIFSSEGNDEDGLYMDIFRLNRDWGEGTLDYEAASKGEVTWNSAKHGLENWSIAGADHTTDDRVPIPDVTEFIPCCCGWRAWNVKSTIKDMVADNENYGWILKAHEEDKDKYYRFHSSEHHEKSRRPKLTIVVKIPSKAGAKLSKKNIVNTQLSLSNLPLTFEISQNYPNPFNPDTYIKYQLPEDAHVVIRIFNTLGQEIKTLVNEDKTAGYHSVYWDRLDNNGNQVGSGIYLYQIRAGSFICTKKMILLK